MNSISVSAFLFILNACLRAAPETTPLWTLFLIKLPPPGLRLLEDRKKLCAGVDVEVDFQRRGLSRRQTDFALEAIEEYRAAKAKHTVNELKSCCAGIPMAVKFATVSR